MTPTVWRLGAVLAAAAMAATLTLVPPGARAVRDPQVGQSFRVPYRLTDTNHFLVRVRINGKGPFNFLVDSGAPALFVATETAKKIGLKPADEATFWTPIDRLDIEGGSRLTDVKARVEDPFQLVGMNALGLPGASIDGILGFTILGRYRLEIDLTDDRMTWTRLDYTPPEPPVPRTRQGERAEAPLGVRAMNALGPLAKGMAFLMGKQPEEQLHLRGFLGVEWAALASGERTPASLHVRHVLEGSPAARAGLSAGDRVLRINGRAADGLKAARVALADVRPGESATLLILRGVGADAREQTITIKAGEGL
jgi:predicted aspartyl protease